MWPTSLKKRAIVAAKERSEEQQREVRKAAYRLDGARGERIQELLGELLGDLSAFGDFWGRRKDMTIAIIEDVCFTLDAPAETHEQIAEAVLHAEIWNRKDFGDADGPDTVSARITCLADLGELYWKAGEFFYEQ